MKFLLQSGSGNPGEYGRWVSEDGRFSVQKFQYKTFPGRREAVPVADYFSCFALLNYSRRFATDLKHWGEVFDACETYNAPY
jgi:hypothetical protein